MKKLSIFIALIALSACKPKVNDADAIKSVSLKFTELGRETIMSIDCDKFDSFFPEVKTKPVTDKKAMDSLTTVLKDLQRAEDGYKPDVRGKIFITHADNKTDTLCVGVKMFSYRGTVYTSQKSLLSMGLARARFLNYGKVG